MTMKTALTALALVGLMVGAPAAEAGRYCESHGWRRVCNSDWPVPSCWNQRYCRSWGDDEPSYRRRDPRPERVYGYEQRRIEDMEAPRGGCFPRTITAVSAEHKILDRAKADAISVWRSTVSWSGGGGEYMDYAIARDRAFRCGPSNAGDNWLGRISKGVTKQFSGPNNPQLDPDGLSVRCQVWATPCRAPREVDIDQPPRRD